MTNQQDNLPRLGCDLEWTLHELADGACYTVLNPLTGLNYQVGLAEYAFASQLDGRTTIGQAAAATRALAQQSGRAHLAISDDEAEVIAGWLVKMKLAVAGVGGAPKPDLADHRRHISALCIRMPLGNPARLLDRLAAWTSPLTSRIALVVYLAMILMAGLHVFLNLNRWSTALTPLVEPHSWWVIGIVALLLRVLHEAAHGLVARRLNVPVGEVGILWILMMPLPYVDISASWKLTRRRDRILIAAAGMIAELAVAAVAVFAFAAASSELARHISATIAVTASIVTLLFNANVLMRFDGYHMLVDAIGVTNLYSDATAYWRRLATHWILGKDVAPTPVPIGPRGHFFRIYGIAALLWRFVVFIGLVLAAEHLLLGSGVVLGLTAVIAMLIRLLRGLPRLLSGARPIRASVGLVLAAMAATAIWHLPVSTRRSEAGIARYRQPSHVRAGSSGFVREILVQRGQRVRRDQPLIRVENAELDNDVSLLQIELASATARYRKLLSNHDTAAAEAQWSSILQLRDQLARRTSQLDGLTIRASTDGVVAAPSDLSRWLGRYVAEGTEFMQLVRPDEIEIVFLVDQASHHRWAQQVGKRLEFRHPVDWESKPAVMVEVSPRATDQLPREALGAHQGGPLAVRPVSSNGQEFRLLTPRFEARMMPERAGELRDGQRVLVLLPTGGQTVGQIVGRCVNDWFRRRLASNSLLHQISSF